VTIRQPAHALNFNNCTAISPIHCSKLDLDQVKTVKCVTGQCRNISGVFNCTNGICQDISQFFYNCGFRAKNRKVNCAANRGRFLCMELNTIVKCVNGSCQHANEPAKCVRRCGRLPGDGMNVVLLSGDDVSWFMGLWMSSSFLECHHHFYGILSSFSVHHHHFMVF
jgi:hypothetical protein